MNLKITTILLILLKTCLITAAEVGDISPGEEDVPLISAIELEMAIEYFSGYTLYRIGGYIQDSDGNKGTAHFPISELEFPLNVYLATFKGRVILWDKLTAELVVKSNTWGAINSNNEPGKMKDSDWGIYSDSSSTTLDVYSESDSYLYAFIGEIHIEYTVLTKDIYHLRLGASLDYQYFNYSIHNVEQYNYHENTFYSKSGEVLTYYVHYWLPYLSLAPSIDLADYGLNIELRLDFSPYIYACDVDDHILRYKLSKGNSTGYMYRAGLDIRYDLSESFFFTASASYLYLHTRGTQYQEFYKSYNTSDGPIEKGDWAEIDNELESKQGTISMSVGYRL